MNQDPSRRKFLEKIGLGTAASVSLSVLGDLAEARPAATSPLPSRTLGRTGAKVSILAFGCGSRFLMYDDEEKALAALNRPSTWASPMWTPRIPMETEKAKRGWAR